MPWLCCCYTLTIRDNNRDVLQKDLFSGGKKIRSGNLKGVRTFPWCGFCCFLLPANFQSQSPAITPRSALAKSVTIFSLSPAYDLSLYFIVAKKRTAFVALHSFP